MNLESEAVISLFRERKIAMWDVLELQFNQLKNLECFSIQLLIKQDKFKVSKAISFH